MRGNLDLRRESFVLGFERTPSPLGKMMARLLDRGDVAEVKEQGKQQKADERDAEKKRKAEEQYQKRKNAALELATKHGGFVTQKQLAAMLGFSSERTFAPVFERMVLERLLEPAGKQGYMLPGTTRQGGLL
jgi:predicted HTH transcriptional regulator